MIDLKNTEEEYEEMEEEDDEESEAETEKDFETILSEGDRIYFLEADGNWWSQKVKSSEIAKQIVENFKK